VLYLRISGSLCGLTFQFHADFEALLETAVRTALPLRLVDMAAPVSHTRVHLLVLHRSLEEAFTRLACQQAVMVTGHFVATHRTQFLDTLLRVRQVRGCARHSCSHRMLRWRLVTTCRYVHAGHRGTACREQIRGVHVSHHVWVLLGVVMGVLLHAAPH